MENIVIVGIDDKSIQEFGVWPWPRSIHANLINQLTEYEAKVVGYDVTFAEASNEEEDQVLVEAIESNGNIILAAEATLKEDDFGRAVASDILWPKDDFFYRIPEVVFTYKSSFP